MAVVIPDPMHGGHFAKQYVTDYLEADLPTRIIDYRNAWLITDADLPVPAKYLSYEPVALDKWPTVITVAISMNGMDRIGYLGADPQYRVTYVMRTYVWTRASNAEQTTMGRDRLTTVVRSALLDYPCLKAADPRDTFQIKIDESTMREEFSDLTPLKGERFLAGAYIGYEISLDEVVMRKPLGIVDEDGISFGVKGVGISKDTVTGAVTPSLELPTTVAQGGTSE